ncbi:MAG: RES family NAD+ phosphorylase [Gammaproteobacteria bacterium]|nr:RES family NAD+ phosphorylase [Gammaproteobacteria bacterium]MDE0366318.1 RES family NAD+ phosphorylase [Gammaproteobacteria bacterium]
MRLWRLSGADYAERFDGGFGHSHEGRWNTPGHPVTYCSTGPALCVLEKLVHIDDPLLLPDDTMLVCYEVPDEITVESLLLEQVPDDWRNVPRVTRSMGDAWLQGLSAALWSVPSAVVPIAHANDRNLLVNHRHEDADRISISRVDRFEYDPRLFSFGD